MAAYGEVDELNSSVGAALAWIPENGKFGPLRGRLSCIQEELFVLGALLATPPERLDRLGPEFGTGMDPKRAARLEREIDAMTADLAPMTKFIMPGGSVPGSLLHLARAVCRRAERAVSALGTGTKLPPGSLVYLNRLSDYLFTAGRWANARLGVQEIPWQGRKK